MPKIEASLHRKRMQEPQPTTAALRRQAGIETVYHVFTDRRDEWWRTRRRANQVFRYFAKTYGTARLYEERYLDRENDVMESENCLRAVGDYPC